MRIIACIALLPLVAATVCAGPRELVTASREFVAIFASVMPSQDAEKENLELSRFARFVRSIDQSQRVLDVYWIHASRARTQVEELRKQSLSELAKLEQNLERALTAFEASKLEVPRKAVEAAAARLRAAVAQYREELAPERFPEEEKAPNKPVETTSGTRSEIGESFPLAAVSGSASHG